VATPEGFSEFVLARQAALLRTAYLLTGHAHDAEDLVQTTLIKVVPQWRRIADNPEPYVRRVLVNENISRWRRRRWREHPTDELPEVLAAEPDRAELLAVRDALRSLAPRQRAVLVLRYYEGLSEAEIAAQLGIAPGTVKSQARDGLATLRQALPAEEGAGSLTR
jgi:RNA polymerase sigma-70 factor (sigma-E family)